MFEKQMISSESITGPRSGLDGSSTAVSQHPSYGFERLHSSQQFSHRCV